jgi:hypothetical protein
MKLLFGTLLCHRDVDTFIFNWFCSRVHLKQGFSIPHLIINDGTLTEEDFGKLDQLVNVVVEKEPVNFYKVPEPEYTAKLNLFELGFMKYKAERVVVLDPDVFFFRAWDSDLVDILLSDAIALMDFGYSCGPNQKRYEEIFKAPRNNVTPTCNTGIFSTKTEHYHKILLNLVTQVNSKELYILGDQGICFSAFHGMLKYIQGIKVAANGAGLHKEVWEWLLGQNGVHLLSMRTRQEEYYSVVDNTMKLLPKELLISCFPPEVYSANGAMYSYDVYDFDRPLQSYPSLCHGKYLTDALYFSGESCARWIFPPQIKKFEATIEALDYSDKEGMHPVEINGQKYDFGPVSIPINRLLTIRTEPGVRTFYALVKPRLQYQVEIPTTSFVRG